MLTAELSDNKEHLHASGKNMPWLKKALSPILLKFYQIE